MKKKTAAKKTAISVPGVTKGKKRKAEFDLSGSEGEEPSELSHESDCDEEEVGFGPETGESFAASLDAVAGYGSALLRRLGDLEKASKKSDTTKDCKQ